MGKHIFDILLAVSSAALMLSCNESVIEPAGYGYLGVSLQQDDEVFLKSSAAPAEDMAFAIEVYKGETLAASCADHRTLADEPLKLAAGTYRVVATSGVDEEAGFDAPFYRGEAEVTVRPDVQNKADVVATLANVMVTVSFDQSITDKFPSYTVTVNNGSGAGVTFSKENGNVGRTGYVKADGTLSWMLTLTNGEGHKFYKEETYAGVKPRQHYALKFSLKEQEAESGKAAFKLVVDDNMEVKEYDLLLDFDETSVPSILTNEGFDPGKDNYFTLGDSSPKIFVFRAEKGIKSLVIDVDGERTSYELVGADAGIIASLAEKGIKTSAVIYGTTEASVDVTDFIAGSPSGNHSVRFSLYDTKGHTDAVDFAFTIMSAVDADIISATPWAKFVIVEGKWLAREVPEGLTFSYKKAADAEWTAVPYGKLELDAATKTYSAVITSLEPETLYYVKAVSAKDQETRHIEFKTETAGTVYNLSFDDWWQDGKVWYPYLQNSAEKVWDSANKATASFIGSSTVPEENTVIKGKAVKMTSKWAIIAFAAGNIYTGKFNAIAGKGADLDWGTPFGSRPLALKGYYNYMPETIDRVQSPYEALKGQMDKCQIQIFLTDWDAPFNVNTSKGQLVDFDNDEHIIAYAKLESDEATDGYKEFTLPLAYRNHRTPKYIVITCASSYLGDYFTGGTGSTLYLDEFSLEYDLENLTEEQASKVNYR